MPAKGSKFSLGNRDYIFNKKFYAKNLLEKNDIKLSFSESKDSIETCNKIIAELIVTEIDGFKLSNGLGYVCVSKFKPSKPAKDWKKSKEYNKDIYYLNLDTLGYSPRLCWFRIGRINNTRFHEIFKFKSYKTLSKTVSSEFKKGRSYSEWTISDFLEKGRLENLYNKKYRKELKN